MEKITMDIGSIRKIYFLLIWSTLLLPCSVFASTAYIDSSRSRFFVGDTIILNVRINSDNKTINAIEGNVLLEHPTGLASLIDINTSGSRFSLWPVKPLPSADNTAISFAGGSPGGLTTKDAIAFNIVLKLQEVGQLTLTPSDIRVYLHDGKGTQDAVRVQPFVADILPRRTDSQSVDEWNTRIATDKTPPEPFEITAGQDASVFDGKKFLSFSTTDKQSDVTHYEVIENSLPPVRSGETYILREQTSPVQVTVIAYDLAGNTRTSTYSSTPANYIAYTIVGVLILILIRLLLAIVRRLRKK